MTDEYPMRINKYLAHEGISTRRGADELIVKGKVLVNYRVAVLGEKVNKGDKVEMRGKKCGEEISLLCLQQTGWCDRSLATAR